MSDVSKSTSPWTWPERAKKALLLILTEEEANKVVEEAKNCGSASGTTIEVPTGRGEEVATVLNTVQPDEGHYKKYGVVHKGCDAICIYSIPYNEVT